MDLTISKILEFSFPLKSRQSRATELVVGPSTELTVHKDYGKGLVFQASLSKLLKIFHVTRTIFQNIILNRFPAGDTYLKGLCQIEPEIQCCID